MTYFLSRISHVATTDIIINSDKDYQWMLKQMKCWGEEFSCNLKESSHRLLTNYNSHNVPLYEEIWSSVYYQMTNLTSIVAQLAIASLQM